MLILVVDLVLTEYSLKLCYATSCTAYEHHISIYLLYPSEICATFVTHFILHMLTIPHYIVYHFKRLCNIENLLSSCHLKRFRQ
jgi:hypothetical protein